MIKHVYSEHVPVKQKHHGCGEAGPGLRGFGWVGGVKRTLCGSCVSSVLPEHVLLR